MKGAAASADRLSHDDFVMQVAKLAGLRSLCYRAQVGAVACAADRRIVSVGWNGPPGGVETHGMHCQAWCPRGAGLSHKPGYADCTALHAEANCLLHAERGELAGGSMAVSRVPCAPCAKQIAGAGIVRVLVGQDEGGVFHRPEEVFEMLATCGVEVAVYGG